MCELPWQEELLELLGLPCCIQWIPLKRKSCTSIQLSSSLLLLLGHENPPFFVVTNNTTYRCFSYFGILRLRQANPTRYQSVRHALMDLIFPNVDLANTAATTAVTTAAAMQQRTTTTRRILRIQKAYRGVLPATLGAIPSSALYFGAYETMKTFISKVVPDNTFASRLTIHALAAATGNALSSLIFVPKELIKQQLQFSDSNTSTIRTIVSSTLKESGIRGLYCGYQATLIRNIPSAIIRFVLYEEFKYKCMSDDHESHSNSSNFNNNMLPKLFLAGALAGAIASGFMTPVDVVKTRLATKTIPTKGFLRSLHYLLETEGPRALYAGAPSRMIWSGAFSAIGFGTFETAKTALGVNAIIAADTTVHTTTGAADKFEGNLSK